MQRILKSAALAVGLLAGTALVAQAQSVSSVPPAGAAIQTAPTQPYASTKGIVPPPGSSLTWKDEHYQESTSTASDMAGHPYSTSVDTAKMGPRPN